MNNFNGELRVVVYYTDGSQYTNKNVKLSEVINNGSKLVITFDTDNTTLYNINYVGGGITKEQEVNVISSSIYIDTQHVAGYCVMRKQHNRWIKSYYPLKPCFSSVVNIGTKKQKEEPHKPSAPSLTLDNYVPETLDYVVHKNMDFGEYKRFCNHLESFGVKGYGFEPTDLSRFEKYDFTQVGVWSDRRIGRIFALSGGRDVTKLFLKG